MQKVGRSIKKNPPTVLALIRNIQHRGALPQINSIIDIYNVESLKSFLAIGGHDLDKIEGPIEFTVSQRDDLFLPILSSEKHVAPTDPVYRDQKGVLAWLDVRDSDHYKFEETTQNALCHPRKYRDVSRDAFRSARTNPQGPCSLHASASI